jgi:hypothetical protein
MFPIIISHDGRVLLDSKDAPTPSQVGTLVEPSLDQLAAREADRVSTKKHQQEK